MCKTNNFTTENEIKEHADAIFNWENVNTQNYMIDWKNYVSDQWEAKSIVKYSGAHKHSLDIHKPLKSTEKLQSNRKL